MRKINERTEIVLKFYRKYANDRDKKKIDVEIEEKIFNILQPYFEKYKNFKQLYLGHRKFEDESRNDMALISYLKRITSEKAQLK